MEERNREEERKGVNEIGTEERDGWIKKVLKDWWTQTEDEKYTRRWIEGWTDIRAEFGVVVLSVHL